MMVDKVKEGMEISASGTDWEVVSLTASVYAVAPGPEGIDLADNKKDKEFDENDEETSHAIFTSQHFVSPPSKDENLPPGPDTFENFVESRVQKVEPFQVEADILERKQEENWNYEPLSHVDLHGIQFCDKGKRLCVRDGEFEEQTPLQGLNLVKEGQDMYGGPIFSSVQSETDIGESCLCDEGKGISEPDDPSKENLGFSSKSIKQSKGNGSGLPCEAWWKSQAASLYTHAKGSTTFWSLCAAAALMGLVIVGRRWHQEKLQLQHSTFLFSINDEKASSLQGPLSRFKSVVIGSHHRIPVIHVGASSGH